MSDSSSDDEASVASGSEQGEAAAPGAGAGAGAGEAELSGVELSDTEDGNEVDADADADADAAAKAAAAKLAAIPFTSADLGRGADLGAARQQLANARQQPEELAGRYLALMLAQYGDDIGGLQSAADFSERSLVTLANALREGSHMYDIDTLKAVLDSSGV